MIITINVPEMYITAIASILDQGDFPSRSELIRVALSAFLQKELSMSRCLLDLQETKPKTPKKKHSGKIDMRSIRTGWSR